MTYLHIVVGNLCTNRCLFCAAGDLSRSLSYEEIVGFIERNSEHATGISLSGGEPAVHPDFIRIIEHIKDVYDLPIVLITNSIPFADREFAERVVPYIEKADCAFHSYAPLIYNHITRNNNAYADAVAGILNLIDGGVDTHIKTLINLRPTYRSLYKTTLAVDELFGAKHIHYSGVDVAGSVLKYPNIVIPLKNAVPSFGKAIDAAVRVGMTPHVTFYPLCLISPRHRSMIKVGRAAPMIYYAEDGEVVDCAYDNIYPCKCDRCSQTERCSGVWENYIKKYGDHELKPIEG